MYVFLFNQIVSNDSNLFVMIRGYCWLVGCIEDLRRFSGISAVSRLGSRRWPISENSSGETRNRTPDLLLP